MEASLCLPASTPPVEHFVNGDRLAHARREELQHGGNHADAPKTGLDAPRDGTIRAGINSTEEMKIKIQFIIGYQL